MQVQNAEELLLTTLSNIHQREQQIAQFWDQLSQQASDPDVKNILSVRSYFTQQDATNIEKCFQVLGKQMPPPDTRFGQIMAEDFRREFDAIQTPALKSLFALKTVRKVERFVEDGYDALSTIAEISGNYAVASLLEHNLADKMDFHQRTQELFREIVKRAIGARVAGRAA